MKNELSIKEVCKFVETQEFDGAVVILLNKEKDTLSNWYHFANHPSTWTPTDLASVAQAMTAETAERLKADANFPRDTKLVGSRVAAMRPKTKVGSIDWMLLGGVALILNRRSRKRLYLSAWFHWTYLGLAVTWARGISIHVGPFCFYATYRA